MTVRSWERLVAAVRSWRANRASAGAAADGDRGPTGETTATPLPTWRPPAEPPASPPASTGDAATIDRAEPAPIWKHPLVRAGAFAWSLVGLSVVLTGAAAVASELRVLVVPLVLALFPAALLSPLMRLLVARRVPRAPAALLVVLGSIGVLVGVVRLLAPAIATELPDIVESMQDGIAQLQAFLEAGPFGIDPAVITDWLETGREQLIAIGQEAAGAIATAVAEGVAGVLFGLVALFFYLKDGARIAAWLSRLFPAHLRPDAEVIGTRAWVTIGAYFRGQMLVAFVDAVFIGLGLVLLRVPLALPLTVLIFIGGLFPIVGAFVSGAVAVLVALADGGPAIALAVLGIVLAVQQIESNVLAPVVLGKATALHPLAVILALAAGGIVLGVLGAFLAVPVAASLARAVGHLRNRNRGDVGAAISPAVPASAAGR